MVKKVVKSMIPLEVVALQEGSYHVFLKMKVNKKSIRVLLDTGASKTVLDKTFVEEKCKSQKTETIGQSTSSLHSTVSESNITYIKEIQLDQVKLKNYLVAVIDLTHVNQTYEGVGKKPIFGIVGSDILMDRKAIIDYSKKILILK
jgi:predicted aspartyl protease